MPIKSIEIICRPCHKCEQLKNKIPELIKAIEIQNKTKIFYEFKHTPDLREISRYSLNPSQTPPVIINGNVELAGTIDTSVVKMKLESLNRY